MRVPQLLIGVILCTVFAVGCASRDTSVRTMNKPSGGSAQGQSDAMENLVLDVVRAQTPAAEADAIRRLHKYETDHGLTYTVHTIRTTDNVAIDSASVGNQPIRADIAIFRGRDLVRAFSFLPKDNRNLALLGE